MEPPSGRVFSRPHGSRDAEGSAADHRGWCPDRLRPRRRCAARV